MRMEEKIPDESYDKVAGGKIDVSEISQKNIL